MQRVGLLSIVELRVHISATMNLLQLSLMHLCNLHEQFISLVRSKLDVSYVVDAGAMVRHFIVTKLRLNCAGTEKSTCHF